MKGLGSLRRGQLATAICLLVFAACAPQAPPSSGPSGPPREQPQPQAPKILTIGALTEPPGFLTAGAGSGGVGGASSGNYIAHDALVVQADTGDFLLQLATEQISAAKGTWVINADGSMDTTWRIHPNIKWQDGVPFTSDDLLFSLAVNTDKAIPARRDLGVDLIQSVDAPDPYTLHLRWSAPFAFANRAVGLTPLPKHLLADSFQADKANLLTHPYFTTEFVGLGPYRLTAWERGSHQEFTRFDDYYRGRPPLDKVFLRFIGNANTMVVTILAGQVDALVGSGVAQDAATDVQKRWEGTGNQVLWGFTGGIQQLALQ